MPVEAPRHRQSVEVPVSDTKEFSIQLGEADRGEILSKGPTPPRPPPTCTAPPCRGCRPTCSCRELNEKTIPVSTTK